MPKQNAAAADAKKRPGRHTQSTTADTAPAATENSTAAPAPATAMPAGGKPDGGGKCRDAAVGSAHHSMVLSTTNSELTLMSTHSATASNKGFTPT